MSAVGLATSPLRAATYTWNAAATASTWDAAANWGNVAVPGSADVAQFAAGSYSEPASTPTLTATSNLGGIWDTGAGAIAIGGSAITLYGATINGNAATGIELDATAGSLTVNVPLVATQNQTWINNSANALTLAGNVNDSASLYLWGSGSFNQTSGAVSLSGSGANGILYVGYNSSAMPYTSSGAYNLSSGSLNAGNEYVGYSSGSSTFTQSGGTNSLVQGVAVGVDSVSAAYNLQGGLLTAPTESIGVDTSGTSIFTQSAGTNSAGSLTVGFYTFGSTATYNLDGGLLELSGSLTSNNGSAAFSFGGGTLGATAPWQSSLNMTLTGSGGNATVDTTGGSINLSGNLGGPGGLFKTGAGTLTLAGSNTYSGGTTVQNGTLRLSNSAALGGGTLAVNGGTLDLNGMNLTVPGLSGTGGTIFSSPNFIVPSFTVNQSTSTTFGGSFQQGNGSAVFLHVGGSGSLTITSTNTQPGYAYVENSATLRITGIIGTGALYVNLSTPGGAQIAGTGTIDLRTDGPGLDYSSTAASTFNGTIAGQTAGYPETYTDGGVTVNSGSLTLSGSNNYYGVTDVTGGELLATSPYALGNSGVAGATGEGYDAIYVSGGKLIAENYAAIASGANLKVGNNTSKFGLVVAASTTEAGAGEPVPEPGTLALLGVGFVLAMLCCRAKSGPRKLTSSCTTWHR